MAPDMANYLIKLVNFDERGLGRNPCRSAKLPPAADFAGPFTSP
jgi:hypothetical protein